MKNKGMNLIGTIIETSFFQRIAILETQRITENSVNAIFTPSNLKMKINSDIAIIIWEPEARHKDYKNISLSWDPFRILSKNGKNSKS